jgi:hypothetical protein
VFGRLSKVTFYLFGAALEGDPLSMAGAALEGDLSFVLGRLSRVTLHLCLGGFRR